MTQTTKYVRCGKSAKMWTGHVVKRSGEVVLAGCVLLIVILNGMHIMVHLKKNTEKNEHNEIG
jgi:hypothetical protein